MTIEELKRLQKLLNFAVEMYEGGRLVMMTAKEKEAFSDMFYDYELVLGGEFGINRLRFAVCSEIMEPDRILP